MARIVVRCRYTGNYVFTGYDTNAAPPLSGGHVYCPYCAAEHVWIGNEARIDASKDDRGPRPSQVREAS